MLWCPGPPLSPARTSSPASPLSRPSMAEPVGDLQPWFMARVRGLYPHLPGTRPPCTQQYTRPPCWCLSRPPSLSPPCWTATWAAPCTRPPLLVRPPSGCCQSPQLQEMVATPRGFPPRTWVSPLPFLPPPPPCLLSPQVSSSRAAECSDIYYVSVLAQRCRDAAWRLVLPAVSQTMLDSSRLVCTELCAVTAALL